jgi:hypothetical protein
MSKQSKKLDLSQLAKRIVDDATGEATPEEIDEKKKAAIESGRKGGNIRARKLTEEERTEIARNAALERWKNTNTN